MTHSPIGPLVDRTGNRWSVRNVHKDGERLTCQVTLNGEIVASVIRDLLGLSRWEWIDYDRIRQVLPKGYSPLECWIAYLQDSPHHGGDVSLTGEMVLQDLVEAWERAKWVKKRCRSEGGVGVDLGGGEFAFYNPDPQTDEEVVRRMIEGRAKLPAGAQPRGIYRRRERGLDCLWKGAPR